MQLGQHFMIDEDLLKRIVDIADLKEDEDVLEIGPGKGALTKYLAKTAVKSLVCVEKDDSLSVDFDNVKLIHADILDVIDDLFFDVLVANLPYHISEPLFHHLLKSRTKRMIIVVGKQFADNLLGETIIGRVVRSAYEVELIEEIAPPAFDPPPAVDSALVRLKRKKDVDTRYSSFYDYSKSKVKNYLLKISEGFMTKNEVREKLVFLSNNLLEKHIYALNKEEFDELSNFIDKYML